jgi:hypothetical protein
LPIVATVAAALALVGLSDAVAMPSPARSCAGFKLDGMQSGVRATSIGCRKARRIAKRFATTRALPRGWDASNPAGCEWLLFRKRDRDAVIQHGKPPRGEPLVRTEVYRGCRS